MELIHNKIKQLRKSKGISQKEVAAFAGVTQSSFALIESGKTQNISIEVGKGIAKALDIPFTELFEIEDSGMVVEKLEQKVIELEDIIKIYEDSGKDIDERLKELKLTIDLLLKKIEIYKRAIYEVLVMNSHGRISIYNEKIKNEPSKEKLLELEKKKIILERLENKYLELYIYLGLLTESDIEQFKANPDFMTISKFDIDGFLNETT